MKEQEHTSAAARQQEGANTVGVPCAATGTTLAPPTKTIIAMEQIIHTTAETEDTGNYNSDGYYTGVGPDDYGNDSCRYNVHEHS